MARRKKVPRSEILGFRLTRDESEQLRDVCRQKKQGLSKTTRAFVLDGMRLYFEDVARQLERERGHC